MADLPVPPQEILLSAVPSQGPGGQHVNKAATAIRLRFDIRGSSLPEAVKQRLLELPDRRITGDGVVIILAQEHRTQERNREEALQRLAEMIAKAMRVPKRRRPTRPSALAKARRLERKTRRGRIKALRSRVQED